MSKSAGDLKREQEVLKQQLDQVRKEQEAVQRQRDREASKLNDVIYYENASASAETDWKAVDEYLNGRNGNPGVLAFTGQESYKEYSTAMMTFFGSVVNLHKALVADKTVSRAISWVFSYKIGLDRFSNKRISGDDLFDIGGEVLGGVGASISNKIIKAVTGVTPTPDTRYQVELDAKGKLTTKVFINATLLPPARTKPFDDGFAAWLDQINLYNHNQNDWILDPADNTIKDSNGTPMTMNDLNDLNDDPNTSLAAFFTGKFDFQIKPDIAPPSP